MKIKVGDHIRMKANATEKYGVTQEGSRGIVGRITTAYLEVEFYKLTGPGYEKADPKSYGLFIISPEYVEVLTPALRMLADIRMQIIGDK